MRILFKYPTRDRPDWFKQTLKKYYSMMSGKTQYRFLITLNEDDETMNNLEMKVFMNGFPNLTYKYGNHKTKVEAVNADMQNEDFDILVLVSDDMIPIVKDFDDVIVKAMKKYFPDLDGALHFPDGKFRGTIITLSIMGKKLYNYFGYIYNPIYKSFGCDNEFRDIVYRIKKVAYIQRVIIKHKWGGANKENCKDVLYKRNFILGEEDGPLYCSRKQITRGLKRKVVM